MRQSKENLTDDMLLAQKRNRGVIQICNLSDYIKTPDPNPELESKLAELRTRYEIMILCLRRRRKIIRAEYNEIQKEYKKLATVKDVVEHIDHVVQVIALIMQG
jgi:membrane dipeptidase